MFYVIRTSPGHWLEWWDGGEWPIEHTTTLREALPLESWQEAEDLALRAGCTGHYIENYEDWPS